MFARLGEFVECSYTENGTTHISGIQRCGSVAACPVCAPVIREKRAKLIDFIVASALAEGKLVFMVTATVQHTGDDSLEDSQRAIAEGWSAAWSGRAVDVEAYHGQIRAWDFTWSPRNGWHPHIHALVVVDPRDDDGWNIEYDRRERSWSTGNVDAWLYRRGEIFDKKLRQWGRWCDINGAGWHVRPVRSTSDSARYLSKVEGGWGSGLELARTDVKQSRSSKGYTPWDILNRAAVDGNWTFANLWHEYETATLGKRQIVIGRKLAARYKVEAEAAMSDEDLANTAAEGPIVYCELRSASEWTRGVVKGTAVQWIEHVEKVARSLRTPVCVT